MGIDNSEGSQRSSQHEERQAPFTEQRHPDDRRTGNDRDIIATMQLALTPEGSEQLIIRGESSERRSGLMEMDNKYLAEGLSKLADFGNLSTPVRELVRACAGRLVQGSVPRDQWRQHVPEGTVASDWMLIEYRLFEGIARYTIGNGKRGDDALLQVLMINSRGVLMERQKAEGRAAEEQGRQIESMQQRNGMGYGPMY